MRFLPHRFGIIHWETKGWFRKRVVLANVPSFRLSFRGNMRTYPRSGFRSGGTSERTLVPVFVPGEHPPKPPFWKPPFCQQIWNFLRGSPEGATTLLHFPSAPDPSLTASKAPFLTLRVATPSGAPHQALYDGSGYGFDFAGGLRFQIAGILEK